jgi:chloride channel protein, CIC family
MLLGIFTGLLAIYFSRMTMFLEVKFKLIPSWGLRLLIGGIVIGLAGFYFSAAVG